MLLENTFHVSLPVEEAWTLLTDLPRIAPCLPGAHLDDVVDGEYRGGLSTRIGPITARYRGTARFVERDDVDHRAVIEARGREERGGGAASATVTAALRPEDGGTRVDVHTELAISGRAAQFGRSLMAEVGSMLIDQFTDRLEAMIGESSTTPAAAPAPAAPVLESENSLNVATTVVLPLLRRAALPAGTALVAGLIGYALGRRVITSPLASGAGRPPSRAKRRSLHRSDSPRGSLRDQSLAGSELPSDAIAAPEVRSGRAGPLSTLKLGIRLAGDEVGDLVAEALDGAA